MLLELVCSCVCGVVGVGAGVGDGQCWAVVGFGVVGVGFGGEGCWVGVDCFGDWMVSVTVSRYVLLLLFLAKYCRMHLIFYPTFATPVGHESQTFLTHPTHLSIAIMFLIRMPTHTFNIIVRNILIALTFAARYQTKSSSYSFWWLMTLEWMGTKATIWTNNLFALRSLWIYPYGL